MLEAGGDGLLAVDPAGHVLACNERFRAVFEVPASLGEADAAVVLEAAARAVENPLPFRQMALDAYATPDRVFQDEVRLHDGRVLERHSAPLRLGELCGGRIWRFRDISAHRQAEEQARLASRRLVESQAVARIGSWEWDVAHDEGWWSDELFRIYGMAPGSFWPALETVLPRLHPDDRTPLRDALADVVSTGAGLSVVIRVVRPDGDVRHVHVRGHGIRRRSGEVVRLIGTQQDLTELRRAEDAVRVAEDRLRAAFDQAPVGVGVLAADGVARTVNQRLCELTGYPVEGLVGRRFWDLLVDGEASLGLDRLMRGEVRRLSAETKLRTAVGDIRWAELRLSLVRDAAPHDSELVLQVIDVTDRRRDHSRVEHAARHDALTGTLNASAFADLVQEALATPREPASAAVVFLDLDRFKGTNDAIGRIAGDRLLSAVAHRLQATAAPDGVVARIGGDEFAVFYPRLREPRDAVAAAESLRAAVMVPTPVGSATIGLRGSVGVALNDATSVTSDELLREAETAAQRVKARGGDDVELFDAATRAQLQEEHHLRRELRRAIEDGALEVVFQPIVDLRNGALASLEALLRWRHPELGDVPPSTMIRVAEQSLLMVPLGTWVLRTVVGHVSRWRAAGLPVPPVAINVSARQLAQPDFPLCVSRILEEAEVPPEAITLEVTETALLELPTAPEHVLEDLRSRGLSIHLDDFGTGYSSLSHLKQLPVEGLKIDRSFVGDLPGDPHAVAIVEAVIAMGRAVGVKMIAEGVETDEQAELVRSMGCPYGQGWLYSRPLAPERIASVLAQGLPISGRSSSPDDPATTMTLGEAAATLHVSANTVRRWADMGRLQAMRTDGGHRRFRRADVLREAARQSPGPAIRPPRLPEGPLPRTAAALDERGQWLRDITLRSVYIGEDHGWFATPGGKGSIARWTGALSEALKRGDFARAQTATRDLMRTAGAAGVPLLERAAFLDALGPAMRGALTKVGGLTEEGADLARLAAALRRAAVEETV